MTSRSVLIVEDDAFMSEALEDKFSSADYEVFLANNGEEGLKMALEKKPSMIILDLVMPKMGGMEMLEKLRDDSWGKNVSVIILTNISEKDQLSKALDIGVDEFLIKTKTKIADVVKKADVILGLA
jgi:DNA-binding response OmpR family regulator